jgi:hypothetical protein
MSSEPTGRRRASRPIPSLPPNWENFLLSFFLLLLFPLIPLGLEWVLTGEVKNSAVQLATATYAFAIGASSRSMGLFVFGLIIGFIFAATYGGTVSLETLEGNSFAKGSEFFFQWGPVVGIGSVFLMHLSERYNRHVIDSEPFFEFMRRE